MPNMIGVRLPLPRRVTMFSGLRITIPLVEKASSTQGPVLVTPTCMWVRESEWVGSGTAISRSSVAAFEPVFQVMRDLGTTGILMSGNPDEGAIIGRVKPMSLVPGRAQVISRDAGHFLAQLVWSEPNG